MSRMSYWNSVATFTRHPYLLPLLKPQTVKPPLRAVISISQTLGIADVLNSSHKWWMFLVTYRMEALSKYFSFFETGFLLNSPGWVQTCDLQFSASWVLRWSACAVVGLCHHALLLHRLSDLFAKNLLSDWRDGSAVKNVIALPENLGFIPTTYLAYNNHL